MDYTTIKIPVSTHLIIKELCQLSNESQQKIIFKSLQAYKEKLFWENANTSYARLNSVQNQNEVKLYENTLMDGIEDEY